MALSTLFIEENDPLCKIHELKILRKFSQRDLSPQLFGDVVSKLTHETHHDVICQYLKLLTCMLSYTEQLDVWLRIIEEFSLKDNVNCCIFLTYCLL